MSALVATLRSLIAKVALACYLHKLRLVLRLTNRIDTLATAGGGVGAALQSTSQLTSSSILCLHACGTPTPTSAVNNNNNSNENGNELGTIPIRCKRASTSSYHNDDVYISINEEQHNCSSQII